MAKKDGAKRDKSRKGGKGKIPKSIGGLKLPKELRKSGERLIATVGTPEGQRMIAAGLAMASAAVARAGVPPVPPVPPVPAVPPVPPAAAQSGEGAPPPPIHPAPDGMGTPMVDPAQVVEAVGQAATAFFDGLFGRKR